MTLEHTEKYLNFLIGYTFEKSLDNGSDSFNATNPFDPGQTRRINPVLTSPIPWLPAIPCSCPSTTLSAGGDLAEAVHRGLGTFRRIYICQKVSRLVSM